MTQILSPLVVFNEENEYTPKAMQAFTKANTHSIKGDFGSEELGIRD
jgi:hypothetical protein